MYTQEIACRPQDLMSSDSTNHLRRFVPLWALSESYLRSYLIKCVRVENDILFKDKKKWHMS